LTFGCAGRICEGKSFHYILEVFGQLKREKTIGPFTLLIAGSPKTHHDKLYFDQLINLVDSHKLNAEIIFLNHVEKMESFYQRLDVFIHSTLYPEPFGLVIAEAMANGCLVIGSDQGGTRDLLTDHKTGFTYASTGLKEEVIKELKKKILYLFQDEDKDKDKLKQIAQAGRIFIENNYSIQKMKAVVEALYLKLT
jgi:glycosyltransferase involved in cell wall biosynthesis